MEATSTRASDSERERIIRDLTQHCGDGRLTLDELEERVAEAYAATTQAELQHALRELPATPRKIVVPPPRRADAPAVRTRSSAVANRGRAGEIALRVHLVVYLSVMSLLVAIWLLTMAGGYFWPVWPALGMGLPLAIHAGVEKIKGDC